MKMEMSTEIQNFLKVTIPLTLLKLFMYLVDNIHTSCESPEKMSFEI